MKRRWLRYFLFLGAGLVLPAQAQLQFTNVSTNLSSLKLTNLFAVTCGGATNSIFVAVGANSSVVTWALTDSAGGANQNLNWATNSVPYANDLLAAAAFGGNKFLVAGSNSVVFSSSDAMNWSSNAMLYADQATIQGLAFNSNNFVAVASSDEISWYSNSTSWYRASVPGISFFDSFFGVTSFSSNSLAACGILGRLVTSIDGGQTWVTNYGNISQPNLFGIASDGGQKLVCVGANGAILTFTNGGTFQSSSNWGNNTLNAVSYVGANYGFIAVGAHGSVLMSTNGANWTTNSATDPTLKANNNSLNGVFFATSGQFKGVGVLVGDHGTIIIAGTPPPAPTNPVGATNCASYPGPANNNPLSVSLVTNADYPPGTVTVDWYDALTNGNRVASNTNIYIPTDNPHLAGSNVPAEYIYYAEERDLRTGFVSTNRTAVKITIYPRPTATVAGGTNNICNGQPTAIQATLTGTGPTWTVTWSETWLGGSAIFTNTYLTANAILTIPTNSLPLTNSVSDAPTNYTFTIVALADSSPPGCGAVAGDLNGSAVVTVYPRPTATVASGTNNSCNGQPAAIQATLTGTGPTWTVTWSETWLGGSATFTNTYLTANAILTIPTNSLPLTNSVSDAPTNYTFTVVALADSSPPGCGAEPADLSGNAVVTVYPRPTATVSGTTNICNGQSNTVFAALTGIGPIWYVTWSETWPDGSATVTTNYTTKNATLVVSPTNSVRNASTNYTFTIVSLTDSASSCGAQPEDLKGSAVVTVYPRPTATLLSFSSTNCNDGTFSPTLTNTLTGFGPWLVYWNDGTIQTDLQAGAGPVFLPRQVYPTNNIGATTASNNVYYVTNVVDTDSCVGNEPGDIPPNVVTITMDPKPTNAPGSFGDQSSCEGAPIPTLAVSVPPNFTALWFTNTSYPPVWSGTNYVPTNVVLQLGTNMFSVAARYNDPILANTCLSDDFTNVNLVLLACTNPPAIQLNGTNGTIQWFGNLTLQSTTNLATPDWMDVTNGSMGTNTWNWTNGIPPINFFRLNTN